MKKIIILLGLSMVMTFFINENEYVEIPSTSIRMRVIANSNSIKDQENKKAVKTAIENKLYELIKNKNNYNEIDDILKENEDEINNYLKNYLLKNNINSSFSIKYGFNYFPEKNYKGVLYHAGNYKSIVVTLEEGKGDNWWCVLYPPLCLIDENKEEYEYRSIIKDVVDKYN